MHDTVQKALEVAVAERADIARTIADRVIYMGASLSVEADVKAIERAAKDADAVRELVASYRGDDSE
ncbi:hypothetical protein QQX13_02530 [Demequina sp. SYSU T00068]|uniref:hypothetical protein n=1 Tax=Demequina lignilytica TaxID=3051663 RepID=UPI002634F08E|nr:hypothetical protein [Demequina sp. SYSU T00068]MDN4489701.1 hypothetical protein [Demequina sp. SYSU T00068]